jgi:hypothetical protein
MELAFSDAQYSGKRTRCEVYLPEMEKEAPSCPVPRTLIEPRNPKAGKDRRPCPLETMLRITPALPGNTYRCASVPAR